MRGYYGIGIENGKTETNIGTLWRTAHILGASFIFTVGRRYRKQSSDTTQAPRHVPLYHYDSREEFYAHGIPHDCQLIGIELDEAATPLVQFQHPQRAIYLLGAEDNGLTRETIARCHRLIVLPGEFSMNVAVAGSIVMYDRMTRGFADAP